MGVPGGLTQPPPRAHPCGGSDHPEGDPSSSVQQVSLRSCHMGGRVLEMVEETLNRSGGADALLGERGRVTVSPSCGHGDPRW